MRIWVIEGFYLSATSFGCLISYIKQEQSQVRNEQDNLSMYSYVVLLIYKIMQKQNKDRITPEQLGFPSKIGNFIINPVTWDNFPAHYPEGTWFLAYTYWTNNYTCHSKSLNGKILKCWINFSTSISPKSWRNKQGESKDLLQHEYGHYLINCVMGLDFRLRANQYGLECDDFSQFKSYCNKLFQQKRKQYAQKQKQYDKDSYHYLDRQGQQKWERWMKEQILSYAKKEEEFTVKEKAIDQKKKPQNSTAQRPTAQRPTAQRSTAQRSTAQNSKLPQKTSFSVRRVTNTPQKCNIKSNSAAKNSIKPLNAVKLIEDQYARQGL